VLNRRLLLEQAIPVLVVAPLLLWLFRRQNVQKSPGFGSWTKKLAISLSLALLVPVGEVPIGAALASTPMLFMEGSELALMYAVFIPIGYFLFALAIYGVLSALEWLLSKTGTVRSV
jgi:hypothetical protein